MQRFYDDEGMNFAVLISLGFAYANITDVGETLATIERIPEGDSEAWVKEWTATAHRLAHQADESLPAATRSAPRTKLLRASTYYDHASSMSPGTKDPSRYTSLWEHHRQCWDRAVEIFECPVEPVQIPYEGTTLEGYFFTPNGDGKPRPTVILNNGSDGPVISQWSLGGRAAIAPRLQRAHVRRPGPGCGAAPSAPLLPGRLGAGRHPRRRLPAHPPRGRRRRRSRCRASARVATGHRAPPRSNTASPRSSPIRV